MHSIKHVTNVILNVFIRRSITHYRFWYIKCPLQVLDSQYNPWTMANDAADLITPWEVKAGSAAGVDYMKLIDRFGCTKIEPELLQRFECVTGKPVHHLMRRGMFFAHRLVFYFFLICSKQGSRPYTDNVWERPALLPLHWSRTFIQFHARRTFNTFYHDQVSSFLVANTLSRWLQETFNVPLVIQLTDDEKFLWKNIPLEEIMQLAHENVKDIVAMGFDPKTTFIFNDLTYMG